MLHLNIWCVHIVCGLKPQPRCEAALSTPGKAKRQKQTWWTCTSCVSETLQGCDTSLVMRTSHCSTRLAARCTVVYDDAAVVRRNRSLRSDYRFGNNVTFGCGNVSERLGRQWLYNFGEIRTKWKNKMRLKKQGCRLFPHRVRKDELSSNVSEEQISGFGTNKIKKKTFPLQHHEEEQRVCV